MFDLSMLSDEQRLNPYPLYAMMRQQNPVLYLEPFDIWLVFRYDDVKTVLSNHNTFSYDFARMARVASDRPSTPNLISSDPPLHTQLRSLVTQAFTPKAVASLEPRIRELTLEMLDSVVKRGQIDLIQELAYPLPVTVIAEMLGVPAEDRAQFKIWSDQVVAASDLVFTQPEDGVQMDGMPWMRGPMADYFRAIVARRRAEPRDDLISALLAAELNGQRLSDQDMLSFCGLLLVAGNVTTTSLIGNAMRALLENPDQMARLRAEPELVPSAIEETLRYLSPIQSMFRVAAADTELSGQAISQGQRLVAFIGSANRDEIRFSEPDRFDIGRSPNPHIAFGHGIHFCLGAPLARLEARVALPLILERMQNIRRLNDQPLQAAPGFIINGLHSLPLKFTPV